MDYMRNILCKDEKSEKIIKKLNIPDNGTTIFIVSNEKREKSEFVCNVADVFELDPDTIIGISYNSDLIAKVGSINPYFEKDGLELYEFSCRLVMECKNCNIFIVGTDVGGNCLRDYDLFDIHQKEHLESIAFLYAYTIRSHINNLHKMSIMDSVFMYLCEVMKKKGFFAIFQHTMNSMLTNPKEFERIAIYTAPFVILKGDDTCYGVLRQFADDLAQSLIKLGQSVIIIGESYYDYGRLKEVPLKGIVGFQAKALYNDFFRSLHGPKFQFWFDNPLHFTDIFDESRNDEFVLCQDGNYADYIRKYYHNRNAVHFPPGGIDVEYSEGYRPYDIVFLGTCFQDNHEKMDTKQREFYKYMLEHPCLTFEEGIMNRCGWSEHDLNDSDVLRKEFFQTSLELKPACRSVIGFYRNRIISILLDAGLTIHVYGDSWSNSQFSDRSNLIVHESVSPKNCIKELQKAKIGLNIMSWHKAGMTERIANIMMSGAVCVSDETSYLKEHTSDGEEIVLYRLDSIDRVPLIIQELLNNTERIKRISRRGYEKARREFSWDTRANQLIKLSEDLAARKDKIKIFVATHVRFNPPRNDIYVPLHVGKQGKLDLGYLGDDTGENISDLNYLYGELTGLYWIWQNVSDVKFAGMCHYRRYFLNDSKDIMTEEDYLDILKDYDAVVPRAMECDGEKNYYQHYGQAHNFHDLDAVKNALNKIYPEYYSAFEQAMNGDKYYWGNLVVTRLSVLKSYAEWLFNIFAEAGENINVQEYDSYHRRVYGFLSEQMFYVYALTKDLKLKEVSVGISDEKAETKELVSALDDLISNRRVEEAKSLLNKWLKDRPDIMFDNADPKHRLRDIYDKLQHLN